MNAGFSFEICSTVETLMPLSLATEVAAPGTIIEIVLN